MKSIRAIFNTVLYVTGFVAFHVAAICILSSVDLKGLTILQRLTENKVTAGHGSSQSLLRFREAEHISDLDVLFIGSSHAYRGFDPRLFDARGYSAFNMGSSSQTPMNTYFLLKYYLPQMKPAVIMLELYPVVFSMDGYESTLDLLANMPFSWELLEMSLATGNPHAVINCIGKLIRDYKHPLAQFDQRDIADDFYVPGGYVETAVARKNAAGMKKYEIKVSDSQLRYFSKILELAKSSNIAVVGVIQPLPEDYLQSISNYKAVVTDLRHIAQRYNIAIWDFNSMISLDSLLDYKDHHHLNKRGVLKFNNTLLDKLEAAKIITRD